MCYNIPMLVEAAKRSKITLLVDENNLALKEPLKLLGFKVISYAQGTPDESLWELAEGTAVLTANVKDFTVAAIVYDFDIIDISNLRFIDKEPTAKNTTAKKIAAAIRESEFYSKRGNWLLAVYDDEKKYTLKQLV